MCYFLNVLQRPTQNNVRQKSIQQSMQNDSEL